MIGNLRALSVAMNFALTIELESWNRILFSLPQKPIDKRTLQTADRRQATFSERSQLRYAKRLVIKLGSAVITREDQNGIALGRLASIVEQVAECQLEGRECIMVTSGAVAFGKQKLTQELLMTLTMRETLNPKGDEAAHTLEPRAAAAVGQSGLMSLYDAMFAQYGLRIAQVLLTKSDFYNEETRKNLFATLSELISLNIVPIINTNDAVSPPMYMKIDEEVKVKGSKRVIWSSESSTYRWHFSIHFYNFSFSLSKLVSIKFVKMLLNAQKFMKVWSLSRGWTNTKLKKFAKNIWKIFNG